MTDAAPLPSEAALEAVLDSTAALLHLPIAPDWRDDILVHLRTIAAAAQFVAAYPLDDERVVAPVFTP